eukprot:CAMPEP_0185596034 /NCGR_PEP_ID=MMETSP0434-20130131/80333_1 /TAXON_ID=626734 ORGANISM="Favella taraikaensis, Strain Fe Narragansett Bay" /NCGR_SAMPLE_ID=MMETSP0434 /ASSEMBLY_ACC=CAM_ASM_000379 /LENGTH=41 /DNA_ID= /DNA_START= /DNA_END= /DNA_ORIENTATION=
MKLKKSKKNKDADAEKKDDSSNSHLAFNLKKEISKRVSNMI